MAASRWALPMATSAMTKAPVGGELGTADAKDDPWKSYHLFQKDTDIKETDYLKYANNRKTETTETDDPNSMNVTQAVPRPRALPMAPFNGSGTLL